jgi:GDPmannose 4,6-dehydratase
VRDWCHARDVVRGYKLMLEQDEPGDYVLAGGVGRTVGDLVDAAFGSVGLNPADHVRIDQDLVRPSERTPPVGDISRARQRLGWEPETSFEAMLDEMVQADLAQLGAAAA